MDSKKQIDENLDKLRRWCARSFVANLRRQMDVHQKQIDAYNKGEFKGRFKTNVAIFHELAKVEILSIIYDRSKSKRQAGQY